MCFKISHSNKFLGFFFFFKYLNPFFFYFCKNIKGATIGGKRSQENLGTEDFGKENLNVKYNFFYYALWPKIKDIYFT